MTEYQLPFHPLPSHKRTRRSYTGHLGAESVSPDPAPAYPEYPVRRTKSSIPTRLMRCLTNKRKEPLDPNTVPLLSRREQRKQEKRERRYLEELEAYQRKKFHDQISRQLEVNQSARDPDQSQSSGHQSVREKVKSTLRRTKKASKKSSGQTPIPIAQSSHSSLQQAEYPPHIDDFQNKGELRRWFHPSDVEATPVPAITIPEFPAELPAADVTSPFPYGNESTKKDFDDGVDLDILPPPPARSPSPCLSSLPRRGITISETPAAPSSRQMQCDYCHDAIKLTGFHYACNLCNDGDCIYCAKCANEGRTCRHELIERTRNIKRHPTNPQNSERRSLYLEKDKDSVVSFDTAPQSIELSAAMPARAPEVVIDSQGSSSNTQKDTAQTSPVSIATSEELFREFENKRREQEVAFREKEVTLREREATLREREAWTATKERDVALVQQLHAAAMLQQRAEVGAQFTPCPPISRMSSCCEGVSRHSSRASRANHTQLSGRSDSTHPSLSTVNPSYGMPFAFRSAAKGKKPNIERASSQAAVKASTAGIETVEHGIRQHTNANKRKAAPSDSKAAENNSSRRRGQGHNRRSSSRRSNEDPEDNQDGEDSDTGSPKRQKQDSVSEPQKLFACPYYKHDPIRYAEGNTEELNYRGCAGGLYRDISRVKQHLKRIHHRPEHYCRRCFEVFNGNDQLQKHSSSRQGCDVRECPWPEKINETQQAKIHVKRPGKDPKELWFEIYSIIFPDLPLPESPYIEQVQPKSNQPEVLEQFIELFNRKLDLASQSERWLALPSARDFLNAQMLLTLHDLRKAQTPAGVPSLLVSPMSPQLPYGSRHGSNSSRGSSSVPQESSGPVSPISTRGGLRPALKVSTSYGMDHPTPASSTSPFNSARSQRNPSFPKIPTHVRDDPGYGNFGESWVSGDDSRAMGQNSGPVQMPEPSSATSTRSTKSVSFAPAPKSTQAEPQQQFMSFADHPYHTHTHPHPHHQHTRAPTLFDFATFDWSAQIFTDDSNDVGMGRDHALQHQHSHSSSLSSASIRQQNRPQQPRADSAYGTLSSAQASRTSFIQPQTPLYTQPQSFEKFDDPSLDTSMSRDDQFDQMACVDPQMLFVNPSDFVSPMTPGLSADVQAYFNRNRHGGGDGGTYFA